MNGTAPERCIGSIRTAACTGCSTRSPISNGLDWSNDGRLMYYVDTPTQSIDVFDFDVATGAIANRRSLARVPRERWIARRSDGRRRRVPLGGALVGRRRAPLRAGWHARSRRDGAGRVSDVVRVWRTGLPRSLHHDGGDGVDARRAAGRTARRRPLPLPARRAGPPRSPVQRGRVTAIASVHRSS